MADIVRTKTEKIRQRNLIKLPEAFLEECGLVKGSLVDVSWGRNYSCVVITLPQAKLSTNQGDRRRLLITEPLD